MNRYDVIIVGGGMVGLALAAKLKSTDLKIAIIDLKAVQLEFPNGEYDLRVSAITRASENLFKQVGAWSYISETEKCAYKNMSVWDGESTQGKVEFDALSIGQENLGHIIENRVLRKALYQSLQAIEQFDFFFQEKCNQVIYKENQAELILESGKVLSAKLLVAADGAFSWLRENSSIQMEQNAYKQKAIVATIETEKPHAFTAYQRFDQKGPLAFLPLADPKTSSIVWSQDESRSDQLMALKDEDFIEQLGQVFENKLGCLKLVSQRVSFPLIERSVETNIQHRVALIGDAAHTIHPLAGQGVNLGFSDATVLAETIIAAQEKKQDIGLYTSLRPYQRRRASEVFMMKQSMQVFKTLFSEQTPFWQMLRAEGMSLFDNSALLKKQVIKRALGI